MKMKISLALLVGVIVSAAWLAIPVAGEWYLRNRVGPVVAQTLRGGTTLAVKTVVVVAPHRRIEESFALFPNPTPPAFYRGPYSAPWANAKII